MRDEVAKAVTKGKTAQVSSLAIRFRPHSLIARQLLALKAPQDLPSADDELKWLLNDGLKDLDFTLQLLRIDKGDQNLKRQAGELLWMFAVIWKDPPLGNAFAV